MRTTFLSYSAVKSATLVQSSFLDLTSSRIWTELPRRRRRNKKVISYFITFGGSDFTLHFQLFLWQWHTCGGWVGVKCISFKPGTYLCTPLFLKWKWLSLFLGCKQKCGAQYHKTLKTLFSSLKLEWMNFVY